MRLLGNVVSTVTKADARLEGGTATSLTVDKVRTLRPLLAFLNPRDRDVLYLIFLSGLRQRDVVRILGRTQPSLCYDVRRIRKRLRFISYLHSVFDVFQEFVCRDWCVPIMGANGEVEERRLFEQEELEIMTLMFYSTSFRVTSDVLGLSQVKVRNTYDRCLRRMEDNELWEAYEIFLVIRWNLNIVRRQSASSVIPFDLV